MIGSYCDHSFNGLTAVFGGVKIEEVWAVEGDSKQSSVTVNGKSPVAIGAIGRLTIEWLNGETVGSLDRAVVSDICKAGEVDGCSRSRIEFLGIPEGVKT